MLSFSNDHPASQTEKIQEEDNETSASQVTATQMSATPLETQVAGHVFSKENRNMGMLSMGPNIVLKALQSPPRGVRELDFYLRVTSPGCEDTLRHVCRFLAAFHGTVDIDGVKFMKLENLTGRFLRPSVADVKMSKIGYDPYGAPEKVALQRLKCPSSAILGFQISGMRVFHPSCDQFDKMDKQTGHSLTTENMLLDGLGRFFGYPLFLRQDVISQVLNRIRDIEQWFRKQKFYTFYSSSILIVYEGTTPCGALSTIKPSTKYALHSSDSSTPYTVSSSNPVGSSSNSCLVNGASDPQIMDVRMIDFTHVYPSTEIDINYLDGLVNLGKHLEHLLTIDLGSFNSKSVGPVQGLV